MGFCHVLQEAGSRSWGQQPPPCTSFPSQLPGRRGRLPLTLNPERSEEKSLRDGGRKRKRAREGGHFSHLARNFIPSYSHLSSRSLECLWLTEPSCLNLWFVHMQYLSFCSYLGYCNLGNRGSLQGMVLYWRLSPHVEAILPLQFYYSTSGNLERRDMKMNPNQFTESSRHFSRKEFPQVFETSLLARFTFNFIVSLVKEIKPGS